MTSTNYLTAEIIRYSRQGLAHTKIDQVVKLALLTNQEMDKVLNVSVRTLHYKKMAKVLSKDTGERWLSLRPWFTCLR